MTDNFYTTKTTLTIVNKDDYGFEIAELEKAHGKIIHEYAKRYVIKYMKLRDKFIYKNIPTNVLKDMKLVIENELKERKLNEKGGSNETKSK